jgi:hypothetical protein
LLPPLPLLPLLQSILHSSTPKWPMAAAGSPGSSHNLQETNGIGLGHGGGGGGAPPSATTLAVIAWRQCPSRLAGVSRVAVRKRNKQIRFLESIIFLLLGPHVKGTSILRSLRKILGETGRNVVVGRFTDQRCNSASASRDDATSWTVRTPRPDRICELFPPEGSSVR